VPGPVHLVARLEPDLGEDLDRPAGRRRRQCHRSTRPRPGGDDAFATAIPGTMFQTCSIAGPASRALTIACARSATRSSLTARTPGRLSNGRIAGEIVYGAQGDDGEMSERHHISRSMQASARIPLFARRVGAARRRGEVRAPRRRRASARAGARTSGIPSDATRRTDSAHRLGNARRRFGADS
jgi:hypothetical protein